MTNKTYLACGLFVAVLGSACTSGWGTGTATPGPMVMSSPLAQSRALPYRIVETATGETVPLSALAARAMLADFVYFGEQHDDPETHFVEFALLEELSRQRAEVVLSLEMFERDVQPALDGYLAGHLSEADFLAKSRPWDRYATDYRPMVQLARARGWRVLAANIPRPIASSVSRAGLATLDTMSGVTRSMVAVSLSCPKDAYFDRFAREMTGHSAGGGPPTAADAAAAQAMTQRFYEAQCTKDETMAESIAANGRRMGESSRVVVHYNGAFHSDYAQGTVQRVRRRVPESRNLVITAVPVAEPAQAELGANRDRADYVIFTRATAKRPGG